MSHAGGEQGEAGTERARLARRFPQPPGLATESLRASDHLETGRQMKLLGRPELEMLWTCLHVRLDLHAFTSFRLLDQVRTS